jgi:hypothetical protein
MKRAMIRAARAMAMVTRWWATKRAMARAAMAIAMAMRLAGDKYSDGKGSKGNGNGNKGAGQR